MNDVLSVYELNRTVRDNVNNARLLHLTDLSGQRVDKSVVQKIAEFVYDGHHTRQKDALSELIVYLEFGLPYERHQSLFDSFLDIIRKTRMEIEEQVDKSYRIMDLTKKDIAKKLIWIKTGLKSRRASENKTAIIDRIYKLCRAGENGSYAFSDAVSVYILSIQDGEMRLLNQTKGVEYLIVAENRYERGNAIDLKRRTGEK